ncbi:MAG: metallophosphoesterase [Chloroflexota bacterium]|nr:metallophosphoesterase [Chloroflexota bacterium]
MPDIRYVCISDMHLGVHSSLLTNLATGSPESDVTQPSPVLRQLVACLKELISKNEGAEKPTLILNGDILELALCGDNEAAMAFERFIELIMPDNEEPLFKRVIYLPGNHDHHLWETARETQYVANYLSKHKPGENLDRPWHTTKMFVENDPNEVESYFLTRLIQRYEHLKEQKIVTVYPNFGLLSEDGNRCVIFTHGQFSESIYLMMSNLHLMVFPESQMPTTVWGVEAENFAWIDFFWSTLGRSAEVGSDVGLIYDKLQDEKQLKKLLSALAHSIVNKNSLLSGVKAEALKLLLEMTIGKVAQHERHVTATPLSDNAKEGFFHYVEGPLREHLLTERQTMPTEVTLVFGHTHKPFEEVMTFKGYPPHTKVYNTGGWVVDTQQTQPMHGGAIILVDENLHAASLRMYNEATEADHYAVKVTSVTQEGLPKDPFYTRLKSLVNPKSLPWSHFSEIVAQEVTHRMEILRERINQD